MNPAAEHCNRCGERLTPGAEKWLELDTRTGTYHKPGTVPAEHSQGSFAFGAACARAILKGKPPC